MPEIKFQLTNHIPDILKIAAANKVTSAIALQCFVANLAIMREHYTGAPHLNYHMLGQLWNSLPNQERVAQKAEAHAKLATLRSPAKK